MSKSDNSISDMTFNNVFCIETFATRKHKIGKNFYFDSKIIRLHTDEGVVDITIYSNGLLHCQNSAMNSPY
jgi:hypothetical protein